MTYEDRQRYRELREGVDALRGQLEEGDPDAPVTRGEVLRLLALLDAVVERASPERWDRAMGAIAEEAARRAGAMAASRGG